MNAAEKVTRLPRPVADRCMEAKCDFPVAGQGRCKSHYGKYRRSADFRPATNRRAGHQELLAAGLRDERADMLARLMERVAKSDDCWTFTGHVSQGYGMLRYYGRTYLAHRMSYELLVGPIPEGLTLDHLCHSSAARTCLGGTTCIHRRCVRPDHLEPVTHAENTRRGVMAQKTHCKRGHEFTPENTRLSRGRGVRRNCRACDKARRAVAA